MIWEIPSSLNYLLWVGVVGGIVGVLGLVLRFCVLLRDLRHRRIDQKRSIVDEFWYRTIIMPICWQPLVELFNEYVERLHGMNHEEPLTNTLEAFQRLTLGFSADKNRVLARFWLLTAFKENLYEMIKEKLDLLEDEITERCESIMSNPNSTSKIEIAFVENLFWNNLTEICKEMMNHHPHGEFFHLKSWKNYWGN